MAKNSDQPIKRASEIVNPQEQVVESISADDVENVDLVLSNYEVKRGQFGDYYLLECVLSETGEQVIVRNGSQALKMVLERVGAKRNLPIMIKFVKHNKQWTVV